MDQLGRRFAQLTPAVPSDYPFVTFVAAALRESFFLLDVGAAGGIAPGWRNFGAKLQGFGFDPDDEEVRRLNDAESANGFSYVCGFVDLPSAHPFAVARGEQPRIMRNPWRRLAVDRWSALQRARTQGLPRSSVPRIPDYELSDLGETQAEHHLAIHLPEFLDSQKAQFVDFLKVDVDGIDLDILHSMDRSYDTFSVLGLGVEVNFFGSDTETSNTFHNIDRFLKGRGFELFDLTIRRYPTQDLPAQSAWVPYPAATDFGRLYQGDAFYARDVCSLIYRSFTESLNEDKLAKLAAIFSLFELPDCAAELLVTFRAELGRLLDVDRGLDLLAQQAQPGVPEPLAYTEFLMEFERRAYGD